MRRLAFAVLLPLFAACQQVHSHDEWQQREDAWGRSIEDLRQYQADLEAENGRLRNQAQALEADVQSARATSAREASAALDAQREELRRELAALASGAGSGVEYFEGPDGPVLRIADRLLFASGSATLSDAGAKVLGELAGELARMGTYFRVEGHTDDVPVKVQAEKYPKGNLQLSVARALEVGDQLIQQGLPSEAVSVTGFGQHRPVADNGTAEGRARNRRVEIVVLTSADG